MRPHPLAISSILALCLIGCSSSNSGNAGPASGFSLSVSPASVSVTQGSSATDTLLITGTGSFSGSVTLVASGLPTGVTAAFQTNPASGSSVVTFAASSTAMAGTTTVTITGSSGALSANASLSLTVAATGSFTLMPSSTLLSVTQSGTASETVAVVDMSPFNGGVTFAATGLPSGVTAAFQTNPATASSLITFTAGASATAGSATVMITGTSGTLTATTTIGLIVTASGSFTIAPSAASVSAAQGAQNDDTITVTSVSPFTGSVTLGATGLPSGVTASFTANPSNTVSGVTFAATATATTGTATVTINGTSGNLSASTTIALTINVPQTTLVGPFNWSSSAPLISAMSPMGAVKDPSIVFYNGQYDLYATSVDKAGNYNMEFLDFTSFSNAGSAQPYYLTSTPGFTGYHTAPQIFYFTPQNKWYLIYQSGQPQFSTNADLTQPQNWTAPQNLLNEPNGATWLDYWIICDTANCYLFFTGDNGDFYRSSTTLANFPTGFSNPVVVLSEVKNSDLFEADNVYKLTNANLYMALIECTGPNYERYFRAYTATSLNGDWTPVASANSFTTPFLGKNNVTFATGVTPWTYDFSSGGLLPSYDQTDQIDPTKMQFLFQGDNTATYPPGTSYGMIPWQLGLATQQ